MTAPARLLTQIQGAVAEYERIKIAERYRRGKLFRARQGEVFWWKVPYGYRDFDARQQLVRTVLERVMVEDGRVDIHFAIPLPDPPPDTNHSVSARFHLRSNGSHGGAAVTEPAGVLPAWAQVVVAVRPDLGRRNTTAQQRAKGVRSGRSGSPRARRLRIGVVPLSPQAVGLRFQAAARAARHRARDRSLGGASGWRPNSRAGARRRPT